MPAEESLPIAIDGEKGPSNRDEKDIYGWSHRILVFDPNRNAYEGLVRIDLFYIHSGKRSRL